MITEAHVVPRPAIKGCGLWPGVSAQPWTESGGFGSWSPCWQVGASDFFLSRDLEARSKRGDNRKATGEGALLFTQKRRGQA